MNTIENINTPSDQPLKPVNSPSAEARVYGVWGGLIVIHHRPVPCTLVDAPTGMKNYDKKPDLLLTNESSLTHLPVLRLKGGADELNIEETLQFKKRKTN